MIRIFYFRWPKLPILPHQAPKLKFSVPIQNLFVNLKTITLAELQHCRTVLQHTTMLMYYYNAQMCIYFIISFIHVRGGAVVCFA